MPSCDLDSVPPGTVNGWVQHLMEKLESGLAPFLGWEESFELAGQVVMLVVVVRGKDGSSGRTKLRRFQLKSISYLSLAPEQGLRGDPEMTHGLVNSTRGFLLDKIKPALGGYSS